MMRSFELKSKEKKEKKDKQKKQNKWQMNRELYLCSLLMLAVFAGMIWYLADYVSSNQEALFNNSYNSQQRVLAQENTRGTIYAGTGEVLAQTVIAEDGTSVREYPYKNIFAHVVGYTDKGKTGIEELENYQLIHSDISDREKLDHELAGEKKSGKRCLYNAGHLPAAGGERRAGVIPRCDCCDGGKNGKSARNGQQARL